ncbi:MAG: iron ABC transporter permease [Prevotellaceae bacterium]|jgi:iron complex transport system permease protein|nr:iron ABC transporter permease [Prevotellaceae bacterium]
MARLFLLLILLFVVAFCADILFGSVILPAGDVWAALTGNNGDEIVREIILNHRLPKALTAVLIGAALSVAGVLMQTLFHNPLAGPDVLGVTSGAGLGVALLTLGSSLLPVWLLGWGQVTAAFVGAMGVLLLVIAVAMRIRQSVFLLILGMMFGYFTSAIVNVLQSFSNPDTLKLFVTWTFGSLSAVSWDYMQLLAPLIAGGILLSYLLQKPLNVFSLGDNYAIGLGVNVKRLRLWALFATALLSGVSTAFTGPIAFIGITIPHIARGLFRTSNHRILLTASILCGSITLLLCDLISQLPGTNGTLPINAVTALIGVPIIVWIVIRNSRRIS